MDNKKRNKLRDKIRVAASLTNHQAGKVASVVLEMLEEEKTYVPRVPGPRGIDSKEIIRQSQAKLPRSKRKPEDCAKDCNGPMCNGCPDFIAIPKLSFTEHQKELKSILKSNNNFKSAVDLKSDVSSPFELEIEPTTHGVILTEHLEVEIGSVFITPKEFELIRASLLGAMSSSVNDSINRLQKKMDKDEEKQAIIENILVVLKLKNKLDKI